MNKEQLAIFWTTLLLLEPFVNVAESASVSGGWNEWSEWSTCFPPCDGHHHRTRTCQSQTSCSGDTSETTYCTVDPYAVPCEVGSWTDWTPCTVTCGGGIKTRVRPITKAGTLCGGCNSTTDARPCSLSTCPPPQSIQPNPDPARIVVPVLIGAGAAGAVAGGIALGSALAEFIPLLAFAFGRRGMNETGGLKDYILPSAKEVTKP